MTPANLRIGPDNWEEAPSELKLLYMKISKFYELRLLGRAVP